MLHELVPDTVCSVRLRMLHCLPPRRVGCVGQIRTSLCLSSHPQNTLSLLSLFLAISGADHKIEAVLIRKEFGDDLHDSSESAAYFSGRVEAACWRHPAEVHFHALSNQLINY